MEKINKHVLIQWVVMILLAVGVVTIFSKCSFLYATNDWADTNIYFSIGKAISRGSTMYTELFDHKGILIYLIYAVAALIDFDSFIGVWLIECILMVINIYLLIKIMDALNCRSHYQWFIVLTFMITLCASRTYWFGGSAEELCFPCFLYAIYQLILLIKTNRFNCVGCGIAMAWIFWIKFTLIGVYIGLCGFALIWLIIQHRPFKSILRMIAKGLLGFIIISLPLIIMMLVQGNLSAGFETYIYDNLFLYGSTDESIPSRFLSILYACLSYCRWNPIQAIVCFSTVVWLIHKKQWSLLWGIINLVGFTVLVMFWGNSLFYYGLPLFAFSCIGWTNLLSRCLDQLNHGLQYAIIGISLVVLCGISTFISPTLVTTLRYPDYVDLLLAYSEKIDDPSVSILNYRAMDTGLESTVHTMPQVKYFFTSNIPESKFALPFEMQDQYIAQGIVDVIITTRDDIDPLLLTKYTLISKDTITIMDSEYIPRELTYYLYERSDRS